MSEANINIKLDRGADNHAWTVLGTLLACGALVMGAWAVSNAGLLDLAATGLTMFGFQLVALMLKAGLIVVPEKKSAEFQQTAGNIKIAWREFQEWQGRSPIWRLAALALAYTFTFLIARWGLSVALMVFANVWIAGAVGALMASLIVAPTLFAKGYQAIKTKSGIHDKTPVAQDGE